MIGMLNKTCSTKRPTTANGALGVAKTPVARLTDVACALQQRSAKEMALIGDGLTSMTATHRLWLEYGTDLLKTDTVTVGSVTYEVIEIDADVGGVGHHMAALLLEVRT